MYKNVFLYEPSISRDFSELSCGNLEGNIESNADNGGLACGFQRDIWESLEDSIRVVCMIYFIPKNYSLCWLKYRMRKVFPCECIHGHLPCKKQWCRILSISWMHILLLQSCPVRWHCRSVCLLRQTTSWIFRPANIALRCPRHERAPRVISVLAEANSESCMSSSSGLEPFICVRSRDTSAPADQLLANP